MKKAKYSTWIQLGMTLKNIRAPLEVWEELNMKSKKFKNNSRKHVPAFEDFKQMTQPMCSLSCRPGA